MGELFAHFEKKMGQFRETYKIFPRFSHDFSQCTQINRAHSRTTKSNNNRYFGEFQIDRKNHSDSMVRLVFESFKKNVFINVTSLLYAFKVQLFVGHLLVFYMHWEKS